MPRGFLVKRTKTSGTFSHRVRRGSDDDRSDSSSDVEHCAPVFGSPDSGFCLSPHGPHSGDSVRSPLIERFAYPNRNCHSLNSTPISSPITVNGALRTFGYPSPLYFSSFDRLTVSSPNANTRCIDLTSPKSDTTGLARDTTPSSPNKRRTNSETDSKPKTPKKSKAIRKINFNEDTTSPVSGTIIRDLDDDTAVRVCGDIDSAYNIVEVTPEARSEIEKIENKIGDYICQLCKELYGDAFQLAQHRCSRIIHVEYRCPECDKVFNCPANLASHRRWHKPKPNAKPPSPPKIISASIHEDRQNFTPNTNSLDLRLANHKIADIRPEQPPAPQSTEMLYSCEFCAKKFRRQAYLRKHLISHLIKSGSKVYPCDLTVPVVRDKALQPRTDARDFARPRYPCNPVFSNQQPFDDPRSPKTFTCPHCKDSFLSFTKVTHHIHAYHLADSKPVIALPLSVNNRPC